VRLDAHARPANKHPTPNPFRKREGSQKDSPMAEITAASVKELRERTGAGMMDCKKALTENGGDFDKSIDWLRQKGISKAGAKSSRAATEGMVESYIHMGGKIGVLVEINSETDFSARNEKFKALAKDIAMHIAAAAPKYTRREEVPVEDLEREKNVLKGELKEQGKPEAMWEKILTGKVEKFYKDNCLVDQIFVKDPEGKKTVDQVVKEAVAVIGENIQIRRFARFVLGEGMEKKTTDFAAEVAAAAGLNKA
jgi:elongation factor Ts